MSQNSTYIWEKLEYFGGLVYNGMALTLQREYIEIMTIKLYNCSELANFKGESDD